MSLEALCEALIKYDSKQIKTLLGQGDIDVNAIYQKFNLRPIDIAAHTGNLTNIRRLVEAGARMARPEILKPNTLNVVLSYIMASDWYILDARDWFLKSEQLNELQTEDISEEHICAGFDGTRYQSQRVDIEDIDGLTPAYYAAVRNKFFLTWLSPELKTNFPNHKLQKGRFANTTGAWWLTHSRTGTEILETHFKDCLNSIDLNSTFDIGLHPKLGLKPKSVLFRLLITGSGKSLLAKLPNLQFNTIDWNASEFNCTAAFLFADSHHSKRLLQVPKEVLVNFDWVSSYQDDTTHVMSIAPLLVKAGTTLALQIQWSNKDKSLLANLPVEVINKINWAARCGKDNPRLISYQCKGSTLEKLTPELTMILEKLSITTLESIYNDLEREDERTDFMTLPFITFEFLKKIIASFPDETNLHSHYLESEIYEKLEQLSNLFAELAPYQSKCNKMCKRVNGLKGQFLDRMSLSENSAKLLLSMVNSFFKVNTALALIEKPVQRVKAIALTYLMRGEKVDRVQGGFLTYSIFKSLEPLPSIIGSPCEQKLPNSINL